MFILCTLRHASNKINDLEFEDHPEGKISVEEVSPEVAEYFAQIEGFTAVKEKKVKAPKSKTQEKTQEELDAEAAAAAEAEATEEAAAKEAAEKAAAEAASAKSAEGKAKK